MSRHDTENDRPARPRSPGAPSNAALAERMARVEEKTDQQVETLDRIEATLDGRLDDVEQTVDSNETRTRRLWTGYRIAKWTVGLAASAGLLSQAVGAFPF